jgi:hypothetical protein
MRQRVESHAFVVCQNQRDLWASQCHARLLVDEYDGPRYLFHTLRGQDTSEAAPQTVLRVQAKLDKRRYKTGVVVTKDEMRGLALHPHAFHGDWNYAIRPRPT